MGVHDPVALILAAGRGTRLADAGRSAPPPPKCLLRVGGRSLLERHLLHLRECGIRSVTVAVGYEAAAVRAELERVGHDLCVQTVYNPDFQQGSLVTLWTARKLLLSGRPLLLMDADVLYDARILERLVASQADDALLIDRGFEPGDEPVKVWVSKGRIVELRKQLPPELDFDVCGESVGFFRLSPESGRELVRRSAAYLEAGRFHEPHEEVLRDMLRSRPAGAVGIEDVTGWPWIEIDFPEDLRRAREEVLPALATAGSAAPPEPCSARAIPAASAAPDGLSHVATPARSKP